MDSSNQHPATGTPSSASQTSNPPTATDQQIAPLLERELLAYVDGASPVYQAPIENAREMRFTLRLVLAEWWTMGQRGEHANRRNLQQAARNIGNREALDHDTVRSNAGKRLAMALGRMAWGQNATAGLGDAAGDRTLKEVVDIIKAVMEAMTARLVVHGTAEVEYDREEATGRLEEDSDDQEDGETIDQPAPAAGPSGTDSLPKKGRRSAGYKSTAWTTLEYLDLLRVVRDHPDSTWAAKTDLLNNRTRVARAAAGLPEKPARTMAAVMQQKKTLADNGKTIAGLEAELAAAASA